MPVHDWRRVHAGAFHSFHGGWLIHIKESLNGLLPDGYYADFEQVGVATEKLNADVLTLREPPTPFGPGTAGVAAPSAQRTRRRFLAQKFPRPRPRPRRLSIRHASGHQVIALLEIVSPANKDRRASVRSFAAKVVRALWSGVHVLVVDILPPGRYDPRGMHEAIWDHFGPVPYDLPADEPLTLASYVADEPVTAHVEHLALGAALPAMPLFLTPDYAIGVPLEATYAAAWHGTPRVWRDALEGPLPPGA